MSRLWKTVCGRSTVETKRQRHHRMGKFIVTGKNPISGNSKGSRCVVPSWLLLGALPWSGNPIGDRSRASARKLLFSSVLYKKALPNARIALNQRLSTCHPITAQCQSYCDRIPRSPDLKHNRVDST